MSRRIPVPNVWQQQMALLEEIDRRLSGLLTNQRRMSPATVRAEVEAVLNLIRPVLVREGRRPPT
jgi:hypothetical protein